MAVAHALRRDVGAAAFRGELAEREDERFDMGAGDRHGVRHKRADLLAHHGLTDDGFHRHIEEEVTVGQVVGGAHAGKPCGGARGGERPSLSPRGEQAHQGETVAQAVRHVGGDTFRGRVVGPALGHVNGDDQHGVRLAARRKERCKREDHHAHAAVRLTVESLGRHALARRGLGQQGAHLGARRLAIAPPRPVLESLPDPVGPFRHLRAEAAEIAFQHFALDREQPRKEGQAGEQQADLAFRRVEDVGA